MDWTASLSFNLRGFWGRKKKKNFFHSRNTAIWFRVHPFVEAERHLDSGHMVLRTADHLTKLTYGRSKVQSKRRISLQKKNHCGFPEDRLSFVWDEQLDTNVFYLDGVWMGQMCKGRLTHINSNRSCQFCRIHVGPRTHANHSTHHKEYLNPPAHHCLHSLHTHTHKKIP